MACLRVFVRFGACSEWSYRIVARLAWSPKPTVTAPEYFNALVPPVHVTQYVTTLVASRHLLPPYALQTGASLRLTHQIAPCQAQRREWVDVSVTLPNSPQLFNFPVRQFARQHSYINATSRCQALRMTEIQISRVHRTWLDKLRLWPRAYQTKIFDGRREVFGRGPTPEAAQDAAERLWVTELPTEDK